jgi:hypothetical protein
MSIHLHPSRLHSTHLLFTTPSLLIPIIVNLSTILSSTLPLPSYSTRSKIHGVRDPIHHLYLQANARDASIPMFGPESSAGICVIGDTI